jgi:hypothetical protein
MVKKNNIASFMFTSMKIPSTPTATDVLAMQGISSLKPLLATPPPSSLESRTKRVQKQPKQK